MTDDVELHTRWFASAPLKIGITLDVFIVSLRNVPVAKVVFTRDVMIGGNKHYKNKKIY